MPTAEHNVKSPGRAVAELTPDDLELERYLLDLALQPLERFDGFSHIEQYLLSALRYQLNYACYALAHMLTSPFLGPLPDRIGRRPVVLLGMVLAGCSTLVLALEPIQVQ
jgi:MFS family permease